MGRSHLFSLRDPFKVDKISYSLVEEEKIVDIQRFLSSPLP